MDNQEILAIYETVADITDKMLAAARTGDWEQLAALESHCSSQVEMLKLSDHPQQPLTPTAREQKTRIIKKILEDDRQIRDLTEPWMARLSALMKSSGTERKLAQVYGTTQGT
jgi:flagellar protein FliT